MENNEHINMSFFKKIKESPLIRNLLIFLAVLGPGIVTGSVDNDAGGITTYSVAGAMYGYKLLWTLIPSFVLLLVVQEMNARMGIVTGKGLADLIRENFGVKITFFIFLGLVTADIGNTATEFAGVAGSLMVFGVSKYISVPLTAAAVWILVVKGDYKIAERIFLFFSFCLLSYIISAVLAKPDWAQIASVFYQARYAYERGLYQHGARHSRHDRRALDAVLYAVRGHRKRHKDRGLQVCFLGCHDRLHRHHCRGVFHNYRLRRDTAR